LTKANEISLESEKSLNKLKKEGSKQFAIGGGVISIDGKFYPVASIEYGNKIVSYEVLYSQQASGAIVKFKL
jgi:hypothetical protein